MLEYKHDIALVLFGPCAPYIHVWDLLHVQSDDEKNRCQYRLHTHPTGARFRAKSTHCDCLFWYPSTNPASSSSHNHHVVIMLQLRVIRMYVSVPLCFFINYKYKYKRTVLFITNAWKWKYAFAFASWSRPYLKCSPFEPHKNTMLVYAGCLPVRLAFCVLVERDLSISLEQWTHTPKSASGQAPYAKVKNAARCHSTLKTVRSPNSANRHSARRTS